MEFLALPPAPPVYNNHHQLIRRQSTSSVKKIQKVQKVSTALNKTEKIRITPLEKRIPVIKASRETRNFQTLQQSLCIALLSQYATITIKQPAKKSTVTQQYMRIKSIDFGNGDVINLNEFLKKRCTEQKEDDIHSGVSIKTATRRYQNNKKIELLHLLVDLLDLKGYVFESRYTEGKPGTNKQESIKKVIKRNRVIVNSNELIEKSEAINTLLAKKLELAKKELVIPKSRGDLYRLASK
ncbi:TATA-binding protein-associated phosphoprotein [Entamoeba marina]